MTLFCEEFINYYKQVEDEGQEAPNYPEATIKSSKRIVHIITRKDGKIYEGLMKMPEKHPGIRIDSRLDFVKDFFKYMTLVDVEL